MNKLFAENIFGRFVCLLSLCVIFAAGANSAHAQTDAFSIQIAVSDRTVGEQKNAYQVAMRKVLLANSGDKTLLNRDDVREGLRAADTYVESFRYETPEAGSVISRDTPLTDSVRKSGKATLIMMIDFNRELIEALIQKKSDSDESEEAQFDAFSNVSSALMWLLIEDGERQILISSNTAQNVLTRAREIAGAAGILLTFPAGSEKDEQALAIEDIQSANIDAIGLLASRYAQNVTLTAHLKRTTAGTWDGQWLKWAAGEHQSQSLNSASLDEALQQGIAWLKPQSFGGASGAATSTSTSASTSGPEGLVWVSPLRSTAEYAKVIALFNSVVGVDSVYPKEVLDGGMLFSIAPRSAVPLVTDVASTSEMLRKAATPTSANESRFASGISASFEYIR